MGRPLPRLRRDLDLMPSPVAEQPGLLIRDPLRFSDTTAIVPPALAQCLGLFDGQHDTLDLRAALVEITGQLEVGEIVDGFVAALANAAFLEDETYAARRSASERAFVAAPRRLPAHAGGAYAEDPDELRAALDGWLADGAGVAADERFLGVAAPHVSLEGGGRCFGAAYAAIPETRREATFVILGTSHYGAPDCFGLTTKPFVTPLGETSLDREAVAELVPQGGGDEGVRLEDYAHAVEHSIELQVLFLQRRFGADVRILPILCGPFVRGMEPGGWPEDAPGVARFCERLAAFAQRRDEGLVFVLGVDLAHLGRRYGDPQAARADEGWLARTRARDLERLEHVAAGDRRAFWRLVRDEGDPQRWCGATPLYTLLRAAPPMRGELLRYEQWNIDPASVVSFAALVFFRAEAP